MATKFFTRFNPPPKCSKHFYKPSLTDPQFLFDSDINNIINGMALTPQQAQPAQFGQVFDVDMYQNSLNIVSEAKSEFEKLPSSLRREFNNDPKQFIEFIDNAKNDKGLAQKAVKLGVFKKDILDSFKDVSQPVKPIVEPSGDTINQVPSSD